MSRVVVAAALAAALGACTTTRQAKIALVSSLALGSVGGYMEHELRGDDSYIEQPPITMVFGAVIAAASIAGILLLEDRINDGDRVWKPALERHGSALLVAIQRTPGLCMSDCSLPTVAVYLDGTVEYDGRVGKPLEPSQLAAVEHALASAPLGRFRDVYTDRDVFDLGGVYLWLHPRGGPMKKVVHYGGDLDAPSALNELEAALYDILMPRARVIVPPAPGN